MPSWNRETIRGKDTAVAASRGSRQTSGLRALIAVLILLLAPSILFAHARLVRSSPKAGERLAASPTRITLVFSEALMMAVARIALTDARGDTIRLGPIRPDSTGSHTILADLSSPLASGTYSVHWVAAGRDGHPERGSFSFTVVGSSPSAVVAVSADTVVAASAADAVALGPPLTIARWLGFLALFSVVGAIAFRFAVLPRVARSSAPGDPFMHVASVGTVTYGLIASIGLVLATVIKLYGESLAMRDIPPEAILFATGWGWAWCAQMVACLLAVAGFGVAHRGTPTGWRLAALAAAVLVVTPAATGHAIGSDEALFAIPLDVLHILAGSTWLGTLAVILIVGIGAAAKTPGTVPLGARVAAMINAFSPLALICGATIVLTGVVASLLHLEPLSTLWTSWYGQVLIVKLAVVSLLFAVGAWNWRRVRPSLGGDEGVKALRFSAKVELTIAAMVLMVTAFLVALPLAE